MVNISPRKEVAKAQLRSDCEQQEKEIQAALLALGQGHFKDIKAAALHHSILHSTLYHHYKGRRSHSEAFKGLQALPEEAEEVLLWHIHHQADFGFPVMPELKSYYSHVMDSQQVLANDPKVVEAYFDLLENTIKEYNILPENIYNMNETGFLLGQSQSCNIIVPKENGETKCFRAHPGNRETITVVECIGDHGPLPLPMVIFKGKNHMQGWYCNHTTAKDWVFATSPNRWTNDNLAPIWLEDCFNKHTQNKAQGWYHLLILDGHRSHTMLKFIQQAWESCIVCLCLPLHATHLLQPLNVSIFGPLQNAFTKEVDKFARANLSITKKDFLGMYIKAHQVITRRATAKVFKDVGIDSTLCHETVLVCMSTYQCESRPPTPSTSAEAKQLMTQLFQSLVQQEHLQVQQEELQASLQLSHHQQCAWAHKFGKFVNQLFNQQVIDQACIQELTAAYANKFNTQPGDWNHISQAHVLHQSDLPQLLAERAAEAQQAARKSHKKAKAKLAKTKQTTTRQPALALPEELQERAESANARVLTLQLPLPFPGYDYLMEIPLSLPLPAFPASSSVHFSLPGPSWRPGGPYVPSMPPYM